LYHDEEIALVKDFFIREVYYQNGRTTILDDAHRIVVETVGIDDNNTYVRLTNSSGENINNVLKSGVVINRVLQAKLQLNIGDKLFIYNTHENIETAITITGIADQYSRYIMYTDREDLCTVFGYENGSYNSVLTDHTYPLSDPQIEKILSITDFRAGLAVNMGMFEFFFILLSVLAVVLAFVMIVISANILIEENSKNISTLKVLGYSSSEVSTLVVNTYSPVLLIGYLLAIPASLQLMNFFRIFIEEKFELPLLVSLSIFYAVIGFVIIMLAYYAGLRFSRRHIDKIVLAEALKFE
jgi:putative ABC transport system permease protein